MITCQFGVVLVVFCNINLINSERNKVMWFNCRCWSWLLKELIQVTEIVICYPMVSSWPLSCGSMNLWAGNTYHWWTLEMDALNSEIKLVWNIHSKPKIQLAFCLKDWRTEICLNFNVTIAIVKTQSHYLLQKLQPKLPQNHAWIVCWNY